MTFYIRGKPWTIDVDDYLFFSNWNVETDVTDPNNPIAFYNNPSPNGDMWASILEKAWAKIKGSYASSDGGYTSTGLRALTGAPTMRMDSIGADDTAAVFALIQQADQAGYVMGAETAGGSDD